MTLPRATCIAVPGALLLFAVLPVRALELNKYDLLSGKDQGRYLYILLTRSEDLLRKQGKTDMANRIVDNFEVLPVGKKISAGMEQLGRDLEAGRSFQIRNGQTLHVEHALLLTFKKFNIEVAQADMMGFAKDFQPTPPSR